MADPLDPFDDLLAWLSPEPEIAGLKYEVIRGGLIRIFVSQGFSDPEDLADLTFKRVARKLPEIRHTFEGDKARYFHGVARNIIHEARRRREVATDRIPDLVSPEPKTSDAMDCLRECLEFVSPDKADLILEYYLYDGHDKIMHHERMAKERGITNGALRTRAFHIRAALEKCVSKCINGLAVKRKGP